MPELTESEILAIVGKEESAALTYDSELSEKRKKLLKGYNQELYGDEVEGQSKVVTSDIADVIETMLPSLLRIFTQSNKIAVFDSDRADDEQEAEDKTHYSNYVFTREHDGVLILHNMIKDALMQYVGVVKVSWDSKETTFKKRLSGLSPDEYKAVQLATDYEIIEEEEYDDGTYEVVIMQTNEDGCESIENIPPEEFVISEAARDFKRPPIIGHRKPLRRSELMQMGFDEDVVSSLPADEAFQSEEELERDKKYGGNHSRNPSGHHPNDVIYVGEYYMDIDVDGDGITEYYQVFKAGNHLLEYKEIDDHPFCCIVPVPLPHRAIGSCPAEQTYDLQFWKSTLVRQMNNNIYNSVFPRTYGNKRVDLDDLLTPRVAGHVDIAGDEPIQGALGVIPVQPMGAEILQTIEYADRTREVRTGVGRFNQGLDTNALNRSATEFQGVRDASEQRIELIARLFADTGIKDIFKKIVKLAGEYQKTSKQIRVLGKPLEINPTKWISNSNCRVDVGLGSGQRQEKILNLNSIVAVQKELMATGSPLVSNDKLYHALDRLVEEVGLKDGALYFNDTARPEQLVARENELLKEQLKQLTDAQQNPLAEAEEVKVRGRLIEIEAKLKADMQIKAAELDADKQALEEKYQEHIDNLTAKFTELELKYNENVPGSAV